MNAKLRIGMMCAFGAMTPVAFAAPDVAGEVVTSTITGYNVSFSGGGWSAATKASSALKKIEGVEKIMLSGMTAFVTINSPDVKITRGTVRKAFDGTGLKVEGVKKRDIVKPAETYSLAVTGGTWATTNERLRADLEKLDEVSAAFVDRGRITLMMATAGSFDEEKIGKMTKKRKSEIKTATKLATSPL